MAQQTKMHVAGEKATSMVRAIGHDANLCLRAVSPKSVCSKCVDICPGRAVRLPKSTENKGGTKVTVSKGFCVDCGLCCAVCPTSSLVVLEPTLRSLRHLLKRASAIAGKDGHAYITCIETGLAAEDPTVVEIPCLGSLTWEMWTSLMLDFPNLAVFLPGDLCSRCKAKAAEGMLVDAVCRAQDVVGRELTLVELRRELDFTDSSGKTITDRNDLSDGSGFGDIVRDITQGGDDMTEEEHGNSDMRKTRVRLRKELTVADGETTPGMKGAEGLGGTFTAARAALLDAVMRFPEIAARVELEGVRIDESCDCVDELVEACPLGALSKDDEGHAQVSPLLCVACGLCREICPDAVSDVRTSCADLLLNEPSAE